MPEEFISKMAKYVAFLYREVDVWKLETENKNVVDLLMTKVETVRDICAMFGCRDEVWKEAANFYKFDEED